MKYLLFILALVVRVAAASITHTATIFPTGTDWAVTNSIPQFDPSLGTLTNVTIGIGVNAATTVKLESKSNLARTLTGGSYVTGTATAAGYSASTTLTNGHTQAVSGFDGVVDFGGTSGFTVGITGSSSASAIPASFVPFVGVGTVPLIASATALGFYRGPADYEFEVATTASALVTVTYEFSLPPCPECPPACEPEPDCKPRVKPPQKDDDDCDDDRRKPSRRHRR